MASAMLGGKERSRCPACGFVLWRNPAPVGMALIEHEGKLVLIRRREAPLAGLLGAARRLCRMRRIGTRGRVPRSAGGMRAGIELDGLLGVWSQADVDVLIVAYAAHSSGGASRRRRCQRCAPVRRHGTATQPPPTGGTAPTSGFTASSPKRFHTGARHVAPPGT
jgi:hypothetical protein